MKAKLHTLLFLLCSLNSAVFAQIAYQGFEQNASDTWTTTFSTAPCTSGADIWNYSTAINGIIPSAGSQFWGVQDLNGSCGGAAGETITFATTSVAGYTNISIQFDYDIFEYDSGDDVFYTVTLDGIAQPQVQLVTGNANFSTGGYITEAINIPNGTSTVGLELLVTQNGGGDYAGFDNFILDGTPPPACPHSITSFAPSSGSPGTEVVISGTNFTGSSSVDFNGTAAATVTFVDANTLIAEVPATATFGNINITETACTVSSLTAFSVLVESGSCSTPFPDLVISEVYDNASGSLGYIEIYNGTGAAINLSDYQIDRYADLVTTTSSHSYTFPALIINDGQVLVGKVSTDPDIITPDFNFVTSIAGFNDNDRLELVFTSTATVVDDFHDDMIGSVGYVYRRNTTITGPNANYANGEWTTATGGDVSDLGNFAVAASGNPTVTTHPVDVLGSTINMSVSASAGSGGSLTYQWFFNENDGSSTTWSAVSAAAFPNATVSGETSPTLNIGTDASDYDNYQFYCQVTENTSCDIASHAAQFTITSILPLELLRFEAQKLNATAVLNWQVANDFAGDEHCVQRSANGLDFTTLTCFTAVEDQPIASYNTVDERPLSGNNYYRILHTDYLGEITYSPIRVLNFAPQAVDIAVYPNPASDQLQICLAQPLSGKLHVQLIDALGRLVLERNYTNFGLQQAVEVSQLAAGHYLMRLLNNEAQLHIEKITVR